MEDSPLIYLDNDVSNKLRESVRDSQEEYARDYHKKCLDNKPKFHIEKIFMMNNCIMNYNSQEVTICFQVKGPEFGYDMEGDINKFRKRYIN
jgi:DNA-dependent RNA polymerase auxiliary subunit epsilon